MSNTDKLSSLNETKRRLREAINTVFGAGLTEADTFRSYVYALPFWPGRLFLNGEQGAWYDPSDLSTLFQDAAGKTPVTADGDPVGMMLDKSGNGLHAIQGTAARRPVYNSASGVAAQVFDGTDDVLSNTTVNTVMTEFSLFVACTPIGAGLRSIFKAGNNGLSLTDDFILVRAGGYSGVSGRESALYSDTTITFPLGAPTIIEIHFTNASVEWVKDGVTIYTQGVPNNAGVKLTKDIAIGAATAGTTLQHWLGSHHGTVLINRALSDVERQATRKYLANKAGVTL